MTKDLFNTVMFSIVVISLGIMILILTFQIKKIYELLKANDDMWKDVLKTFQAQDKFNKDVVKDLQNLYVGQKLLDKNKF